MEQTLLQGQPPGVHPHGRRLKASVELEDWDESVNLRNEPPDELSLV